jgi:hypothetical protein
MKTSSLLNLISCGRLLAIGFTALIFGAAVGGVSFAAATDFNLGLVEGLVCPDGSRLAYQLGAYESDYEFPSASNPIGSESGGRPMTVFCQADGEIIASGNGLLVRTVGLILGGYFLACFIPLLIATSAVLVVIRRKLSAGRTM